MTESDSIKHADTHEGGIAHADKHAGAASPRADPSAPTVPVIIRKRCLHARHAASTCTRCTDVCAAKALAFVEQQLVLRTRACTSCGACAAACPTEALYIAAPEEHALGRAVMQAAKSGLVRIACRMASGDAQRFSQDKHTEDILVPCLARMDPQMLMAAAHAGAKHFVLLEGDCDKCAKRPAKPVVEETVNTLETWLAAQGMNETTVELCRNPAGMNSARRTAFGHLFGISASRMDKEPFAAPPDNEKRLAAIQNEPLVRVPDRQRLRLALFQKGTPDFCRSAPLDAPVIEAEKCACCTLCADVCPSGALKLLSQSPFKILGASLVCCGCGLCADLCFAKAVHLEKITDIKKAGARVLVEKDGLQNPTASWEEKLAQFMPDVPIYRS